MSDEIESVLRAARELVAGPSKTAYATLLEHLYTAIDRGIARALARFDSATAAAVMDGYFAEFVASKLFARSFLEGLVEADSPVAYTSTAAGNYVRDQLRKQPIQSVGKGDAVDEEIDTESHENALLAVEEHAARRRWFRELPEDDQLLLAIIYVEVDELPAHLIELLARRRGTEPTLVTRELAARAADQGERRGVLQHELDERASRITSLHRQIARVRAAIEERDGEPAEEPAVLSRAQLERIRSSQTELLRATPQERSAYLAHLDGRLEQLYRLHGESRDKVRAEFPAGPRYEQVLQILGQLPDSAEDREKAINSLTVRFRRLCRRLRTRLAAGDKS